MEGRPVYIRQFENYVDMLTGAQPEACSMYGRCSMQNVIESDGSVYPCDFYAMDPWLMGNIRDPEADFERFLEQADAGEGAGGFFARPDQRDARCPDCRWYPLCRGGCRRDCYEENGNLTNYYCEAYQDFFAYSISRLEYLAAHSQKV